MMRTGAQMIAEERARQIQKEGWTPAHDDMHVNGELREAGMTYAAACDDWSKGDKGRFWPWGKTSFKPSDDPVRNLVKAGALYAAEIDRLLRIRAAGQEEEKKPEFWYSLNGEEFRCESLEEAAKELWDDDTYEVGHEAVIWQGEAEYPTAGEFVPEMTGELIDAACSDVGEVAEDWFFTSAQETELQSLVGDVVNDWADRHGLQPRFCRILNEREMKIRYTDEEGAFEILEGPVETQN